MVLTIDTSEGALMITDCSRSRYLKGMDLCTRNYPRCFDLPQSSPLSLTPQPSDSEGDEMDVDYGKKLAQVRINPLVEFYLYSTTASILNF